MRPGLGTTARVCFRAHCSSFSPTSCALSPLCQLPFHTLSQLRLDATFGRAIKIRRSLAATRRSMLVALAAIRLGGPPTESTLLHQCRAAPAIRRSSTSDKRRWRRKVHSTASRISPLATKVNVDSVHASPAKQKPISARLERRSAFAAPVFSRHSNSGKRLQGDKVAPAIGTGTALGRIDRLLLIVR